MVAENTLSDGFDRRWDGKTPDQPPVARRKPPDTAQNRPVFRSVAYPGCIPTITAFGEPHLASAPVLLLRQTIFIGLAGAGGG